MPVGGHRHLGHQLQVLRVERYDDVDVFRGAHDTSRAECQPADNDELGAGLAQSPQQLIEGGCAHRRLAASAILISSWLRAIVSARLTLIGRRASSRSLLTRTASAVSAAVFSPRFIK